MRRGVRFAAANLAILAAAGTANFHREFYKRGQCTSPVSHAPRPFLAAATAKRCDWEQIRVLGDELPMIFQTLWFGNQHALEINDWGKNSDWGVLDGTHAVAHTHALSRFASV